ncbi:glycerophosphodiester phosphodiesterase [bacterium]|nr:glycerophosphodiester phosphodiesterase [bacterium]MDB4423091.1 glycerophosphodiester phosphodiesterase [Rhodopirellula sp.]
MLTKNTLVKASGDFRRHWLELFLTNGLYTVIAVVLLTPMLVALSQLLLRLSGKAVLADQDILLFLLEPAGWICVITLGALWLGIIILGQASMMAILAAPLHHKTGTVVAIRFAVAHAWQISQVTARLVIRIGLLVAPFLGIAAVTYAILLSKFDINFYLQEKPTEFIVAVSIGAVLAITLAILLLRFVSSWILALPLVLFEQVPASQALQESARRTVGSRTRIVSLFSLWTLAGFSLSASMTSVVVWTGRLIIPDKVTSLTLLIISLGVFLLIWAIINLLIQMISSSLLAAIWLNLYREIGYDDGKFNFTNYNSAVSSGRHGGIRITGKRLIAGSLIGLMAAAIIGIWTIESVRLEDDVEIIAHRGASAIAPENTLAAMRQAIDYATDWVEIDVQETSDDQVVVFHDSDFMKLAKIDLKIWDATMADLAKIDIGSHKDPAFSSERVPTLSELLTTCKGKAKVVIELKYYGHDKDLEQRVLDIVNAHEMSSDVMYMSLNLDAVTKIKELNPKCRAGLLMSVLSGNIQDTKADFLAVNAMFVNRSFIQRAHASGKEVYVWTINDAVTMSRMIGIGVDGLITDKPDLARQVLAERSTLNPAERLLLELSETFGVTPIVTDQ